MSDSAPPAGWYPDPKSGGTNRWWDGSAWGPVAPSNSPQPTPAATPVPAAAAATPGCGTGCLAIIGIFVVIVIIAWIASAISGGDPDSSNGSSSVETATSGELLIQKLRNSEFDYSTVTDAQLIAGGRQYCSNIDNSQTPKVAITALILEASQSAHPRETCYLVGAAIAALCPEHAADLQSVTDQ